MLLDLLALRDIREHILRDFTVDDLKALACASWDYHIAIKEELYHTIRIPSKTLRRRSYLKQKRLKQRIKKLKDTKVLRICFPFIPQNIFYNKPNTFKWICELDNLVELDLSGSYLLDDSNLSTLAKSIVSLKVLSLSHCKEISDVGLSYLSTLLKLETLDISSCSRITDKGISYISSLVTLKKLNLTLCRNITEVGFSFLGNLLALEELCLVDCLITDNVISSLSALETLKRLNLLCCTRITDTGLSYIGNLFTLEELRLWCGYSRGISDDGLSNLSRLSMLKILDLTTHCITHNIIDCITDLGISSVGNLFGLEELRLVCYDHGVTDQAMSSISTLVKLKRLDLRFNCITDAGICYLRNLLELEELCLYYCDVSDVGLSYLSTMVTLKNVKLTGVVLITVPGVPRSQELKFKGISCEAISDFLKKDLI